MSRIIRPKNGRVEGQMPLELKNIINDAVGAAGMLYFLIYEEFNTKVDQLLLPMGATTDKHLDLKRELKKSMSRLHEIGLRFSIRLSKEDALERNRNDQYSLYLAFKALCRLKSEEVSDFAIKISRNEPNFTSRSHFMKYFEAVLQKSRTSNHDAIQMIQTLYDVLKDDENERVVYDYGIKDFKLSNIDYK